MNQEQIRALIHHINAWYTRIDIKYVDETPTGLALVIAPDGAHMVALWQTFWTPAAFDKSFAAFKNLEETHDD